MDVEHRLAGPLTGVEDEPEAVLTRVLRHLLGCADQLNQGLGLVGGQSADGAVMPARDHEDVRRRLRGDVAERNHMLALVHEVDGHVPGSDRAEDADFIG